MQTVRRSGRRWGVAGLSCLLVGGTLGTLPGSRPPAVPMAVRSVARTAPEVPPQLPDATAGYVAAEDGIWAPEIPDGRPTHGPLDPSRPQINIHVVQEDETIWSIALGIGSDAETVLALNPEADPLALQPGQRLRVVPDFQGAVHTVEADDSLETVAERYGLSVAAIADANQLEVGGELLPGQTLLLPGAALRMERKLVASRSSDSRPRPEPVAPQAEATVVTTQGEWVWPLSGGEHSSEFGARWGGFHTGLDIAVPMGTPAVAVAAGTVTYVGWDGGYGNCVIIDHGDGRQTRYAHAAELLVHVGQVVAQGEAVIAVGSTGNSTGSHLHFEVIVGGTPQNPREYLPR